MNIGSIFNQVNNAINNLTQNSGETVQNLNELTSSIQRGMDILSSLPPGSSLSGTVAGFNEGNLILQLSEGNMIQARLEGMSQPLIGQNLSFMVKGNSEGNITLSPLFANMNPSSTISNALNAAGIPDNPQTQYIVRSMMEEGLSVDKDSLLDMVKTVNEYPSFDPKDIAVLQRLNIPVNEEMLSQFENYKNYEHTISNSLTDIAETFTESSLMLLEGEDAAKALDFIRQTLDILIPEKDSVTEDVISGKDHENSIITESNDPSAEKGINDLKTGEQEMTEKTILAKGDTITADNEGSQTISADEKSSPDKADLGRSLTDLNSIKDSVSDPIRVLDNRLKELMEKDPVELKDKDIKSVSDLIKSEGFIKALKNEVSKQWMLKPEDVAKEGSVRELYDRLNSQIKTLTDSLQSENRPNTPLAQAAGNLSGNINFMNELNQTFNYVQIPLKFDDQNKTGELYVYTNKRSLADNDGTVSALLHLDMDNLGPVDVHVVLNESNNVKTRFMLKDDSALDLIAENIEILNSRLSKRGYNMNAEFINNDDPKTVFENMLDEDKGVPILSNSSFDARA